MANRAEKTKEEKISLEIERLKDILKDLDGNKKKFALPLIEKAAFMRIESDDLENDLKNDGWISEYQNGANQWGEKKSPKAEVYFALVKSYTGIYKILADLVPDEKKKKSALAALRAE